MGPDGKCYVCNNGGFSWTTEADGFLRPTGRALDYTGGSIQRVDLETGAVETVSEALQVAGVHLPPDKYAAAVAVVYQVIAAGEPPGDLVPRLLTLSR